MKCQEAAAALEVAKQDLLQKQEALDKVVHQLETLEARYNENVQQLDALKRSQEQTVERLRRATLLTDALINEKVKQTSTSYGCKVLNLSNCSSICH